jgi:hypothetical protein
MSSMSSITDTLTQRGARYGEFIENAVIAQKLKEAMASHEGWTRLKPDQREALEVIAQKMSRIVTGDGDYHDNWHDIMGYAKLVEDRIHKLAAPAAKKGR